MCDLGLTLGLAMGGLQAMQTASSARANQKMIKDETKAKQDMADREFIVESRASQKDAHRAHLEAERGKAAAAMTGTGIMGSTAGARSAEQARQGSLSIQAAKDRKEGASANRSAASSYAAIEGRNKAAVVGAEASPLSLASTVIGGGLGSYGAFR